MLLLLLSLLAGPAAPQDHCNVPNSDKYDCAPFEADCIAKVGGDTCTGRHHDPHVVFTHCLDEPSVIWSVYASGAGLLLGAGGEEWNHARHSLVPSKYINLRRMR